MIKQLQRFSNIYFYLLVCLCRLMSLFSLLCVCSPRGALTQTVSQLLGGAAYCSFRLLSLSLSLSLSALEGLLLAGRTSAGQLFQNSSSEAVRRVFAPPFSACSTCPCLSADRAVEIQFSRPL